MTTGSARRDYGGLGSRTRFSSPRLPANALDLAIMVDVYHEFAFPYEMMLDISKAMKTGGRVAFVEYRKEDPEVPIKLVHKMTQKQVIKEMGPHPLRWVGTLDILPRQHVIIFEKREDPAARDGSE